MTSGIQNMLIRQDCFSIDEMVVIRGHYYKRNEQNNH